MCPRARPLWFPQGAIGNRDFHQADTELIPSLRVGSRDAYDANVFMRDLADRLANRVQLTSDGHKAYLDAVERAFGDDIDYAMLVKHYGAAAEGP